MKEKRKESIIMPAKKKHPVRLEELTPDEKIKFEIKSRQKDIAEIRCRFLIF